MEPLPIWDQIMEILQINCRPDTEINTHMQGHKSKPYCKSLNVNKN